MTPDTFKINSISKSRTKGLVVVVVVRPLKATAPFRKLKKETPKMALETGTYIDSLNASNPVATDGIAQADDHMRLIKSTVKASFPAVTGAVTSTHAELNAVDGFTGTVDDLNYAKDLRATGVTATEFDYLDGVTSNIQTQLAAAGNNSTIDMSSLSSTAPYQIVMMTNQQGGASDIGDGSDRSLGVESEYAKLTYNPGDSGGRLTVSNITAAADIQAETLLSESGMAHVGDTTTKIVFGINGNEINLRTDGTTRIGVTNSGAAITGALSKSSGSFKIDHPLDAKKDTHHLVHSFVEGPQADNIYRGRVTLVAGAATVNIDTASRMTEGTFASLNGNVQCFTSNETGFTAVKGSVSGNVLSIAAENDACTATVSWMVVGERHDPHMIATDWTDDAGRVIVEPAKPTEE